MPAIAGNPPADAAQPFGINGIIVTVVIKAILEPRAPRIPIFLFQNPKCPNLNRIGCVKRSLIS